MPDNDSITLETASAAASQLDIRYRKALRAMDPNTLALKKQADKAMQAYGMARVELIEAGVVTTDADVIELQHIQLEIQNAADTMACIEGSVKLIAFLTKLA